MPPLLALVYGVDGIRPFLKTIAKCTQYLSYAAFVICVAFVGAMLFQLLCRDIFNKCLAEDEDAHPSSPMYKRKLKNLQEISLHCN